MTEQLVVIIHKNIPLNTTKLMDSSKQHDVSHNNKPRNLDNNSKFSYKSNKIDWFYHGYGFKFATNILTNGAIITS